MEVTRSEWPLFVMAWGGGDRYHKFFDGLVTESKEERIWIKICSFALVFVTSRK